MWEGVARLRDRRNKGSVERKSEREEERKRGGRRTLSSLIDHATKEVDNRGQRRGRMEFIENMSLI